MLKKQKTPPDNTMV